MEVKKIVEGMTAPEVAQVIHDNFDAINTEFATTKEETDAKLTELDNSKNQDARWSDSAHASYIVDTTNLTFTIKGETTIYYGNKSTNISSGVELSCKVFTSGYTTGSNRIIFNINSQTIYPKPYSIALTGEEVVLALIRTTYGVEDSKQFISVAFSGGALTVDGKVIRSIDLIQDSVESLGTSVESLGTSVESLGASVESLGTKSESLYKINNSLLPVDQYDFVIGSLYNGNLDTSNLRCISTDSFYSTKGLSEVRVYSGAYQVRVTFYDENKSFVSFVTNNSDFIFEVKDGYCYCKLSLFYSDNVDLNAYAYGDIKCNAVKAFNSVSVGSDIVIGAPVQSGYINFNNVDKRIEIIDYICVFKKNSRILLNSSNSIDYGSAFSIGSGTHWFVAVDEDDNLCVLLANELRERINAIQNATIIASINIQSDQYVGLEDVVFSMFRFSSDGVKTADYHMKTELMYYEPINNNCLAAGSYYNNYLDTSSLTTISTRDSFFYVRHLDKVCLNAELSDYAFRLRVSFYGEDFTYLSQTSYSYDNYTEVPDNAYYCKFSVNFGTEIAESDLDSVSMSTNALAVDYSINYNNGIVASYPICKGYLNFDNVGKKIVVNGRIAFPYNGWVKYIEEGTEVLYPSNLTPSSGSYFYLMFDGEGLSVEILSTNIEKLGIIKKKSIIACIALTQEQYIGRDNVTFSTVPFRIDGDEKYNLDKLKEFSSNLISENPIETFLFFTDPHVENDGFIDLDNSDVMNKLYNYYSRAALAKCICGGDWLNQFDDDTLGAAVMGNVYGHCKSKFKDFFAVQGNHDYNTNTAKEPFSLQTTINLMMQEYGKNYYCIENHNSRYYIFDSGWDTYNTSVSEYEYEQIEWFAQKLKEGNDNNIIFIHIAFINSEDKTYSGFCTALSQLANAYNQKSTIVMNDVTYDFADVKGNISCIIAGHSHKDLSEVLNGIPVVCTIDAQEGFDLCAVDYTSKKLYMTRIGNGESRTIELA